MNKPDTQTTDVAGEDEFSKRLSEIRRDADGRYCFSDIHMLVGGLPASNPSIYLELEETQELIMCLLEKAENNRHPIQVVNEPDQLIFVAEDLVLGYAMWISPQARLAVLRQYSGRFDDSQMAQKLDNVMEGAKEAAARAGLARPH